MNGRSLEVGMRTGAFRRPDRLTAASAREEVTDLSGLASGYLNDMVVDRQPRAWISTFGFDPTGDEQPSPANLISVDPDGPVGWS